MYTACIKNFLDKNLVHRYSMRKPGASSTRYSMKMSYWSSAFFKPANASPATVLGNGRHS